MTRFVRNDIISLTGSAPRFDLAESVGPDLRLGELLGGGAAEDLRLGYATAAGDPALRAAIAAQHGVEPDDVVVTVGGMHALFLAGYILCGRGEDAIIATPVFPPARDTLLSVGATLRQLPLEFNEGYRLDPGWLTALLSPATRLVSLASPQNPSGVAFPREVLARILSIMAVRCPDAFLLVDETYRQAAYNDDQVALSAATLSPRVIITGSLSKCHGAPGLRIGWAIVRDAALREQMVLGKFNTVIANSTIDEMLGLRVLTQAEPIISARRKHLGEGLALTAAWVERNAALVEWVKPDAGALCCVRLRLGPVRPGRRRAFPCGACRPGRACRRRHMVRRGAARLPPRLRTAADTRIGAWARDAQGSLATGEAESCLISLTSRENRTQ